jgi:hypothetical protein
MNRISLIKQQYEELFESHWTRRYRSYLQNRTLNESLFEQYICSSSSNQRAESFELLPEPVRNAHNYYYENIAMPDRGWVGIGQLSYQDETTYAIHVTTVGNAGWLEVYDQQGQEVIAGRTYIEQIAWSSAQEIRKHIHTYDFPDELVRKSLWQFGSLCPPASGPDRFIVCAEVVPEESKGDVARLISQATGVTEKAVSVVLDLLPRHITRNISKERAELVWHQITAIGVEASIKEYRSRRFVHVEAKEHRRH